jgi:hypothetical protein
VRAQAPFKQQNKKKKAYLEKKIGSLALREEAHEESAAV